MNAEDPTHERRLLAASFVAFTLMAALAAVDLLSDANEGTSWRHFVTEGAFMIVGFAGAVIVLRKLVATAKLARSATREARALAGQLALSTAEASRWRDEARELVTGLSRAIDQQFERWALTAAEKEVGLLLLKGLSHKEIAELRTVTEATARQQARAVYRKAGLNGRHDLSAFFLEDLMLPSDVTAAKR